jgi:hypothetical protein
MTPGLNCAAPYRRGRGMARQGVGEIGGAGRGGSTARIGINPGCRAGARGPSACGIRRLPLQTGRAVCVPARTLRALAAAPRNLPFQVRVYIGDCEVSARGPTADEVARTIAHAGQLLGRAIEQHAQATISLPKASAIASTQPHRASDMRRSRRSRWQSASQRHSARHRHYRQPQPLRRSAKRPPRSPHGSSPQAPPPLQGRRRRALRPRHQVLRRGATARRHLWRRGPGRRAWRIARLAPV